METDNSPCPLFVVAESGTPVKTGVAMDLHVWLETIEDGFNLPRLGALHIARSASGRIVGWG
jgi:hypothetical protein